MSTANIFATQLILGYVAWMLCYRVHIWPRLNAMDRVAAQRAIATLHSFRFLGLIFLVPGAVGSHLPAGFAAFSAYGDFATGVLALLALLSVRVRALFWLFIVAFNLVGLADLLVDYFHAVQGKLPAVAGELGAGYAIPIIYVPLLMITHIAALYLLVRPSAAHASVPQRGLMPLPGAHNMRAGDHSGSPAVPRLTDLGA